MTSKFLYTCLIALCISLGSCGCHHTHSVPPLQTGDLLFQNVGESELCTAIRAVTSGVDGKKFTHCAIVVNIHDTCKVVEAIGNKVQLNSLHFFLARTGDTTVLNKVTVGRVKDEYRALAGKAAEYALLQTGKPYDDVFEINNGKLYCSELLYEAFKKANNEKDFFQLQPMTFKQPHSNHYFPAWENYYKQLNHQIPEGALGINPGLISLSDKITILKIKNLK